MGKPLWSGESRLVKAVWGVAAHLLLKVLKTEELTALFYDFNEMFRGVWDFREILLHLEHFQSTSWKSGHP